jgi:hypothetical protein
MHDISWRRLSISIYVEEHQNENEDSSKRNPAQREQSWTVLSSDFETSSLPSRGKATGVSNVRMAFERPPCPPITAI